MTEFWEASFIENQLMWGFEPADSAIITKDFFLEKNIKNILIPGIGYGRNAKIFLEHSIEVTGIEISQTAIDLARKNELNMAIHYGSVTDMPFDNQRFDGIFSYALIHLLNAEERAKFIKDCYNQLEANGYMVFITISTAAPMFGKGKQLGENYFEIMEGVKMFFYNDKAIKEEFGNYGLISFSEIVEPNKQMENKPAFTFTLITCQKPS